MAADQNPDLDKTAALFAALANPTRLEIIRMLDIRPRSVTEIVDFFMLAQSTISRHLEVLRDAELVTVTKEAQKRIYGLNPDVLRDFVQVYLEALSSLSHRSKSG